MSEPLTIDDIESVFIRHRRDAVMRGADGYVYLMRCGDFMKIGHSLDPRLRLSGLQSGCPYIVTLYGYVKGCRRVEADIHRLLTAKGLGYRKEWFRHDAATVAVFLDLFKRWGVADRTSFRRRTPTAVKQQSSRTKTADAKIPKPLRIEI